MVIPVQQQRRGLIGGAGGGSSSTRGACLVSASTLLVAIGTAVPSFFLGTLVSLYAGVSQSSLHLLSRGAPGEGGGRGDCSDLALQSQRLQQQLQSEKEETERLKAVIADCNKDSSASPFPAEGYKNFLVGMSTVSKDDFIGVVDPGVPVDPPSAGASDVLILYSGGRALPDGVGGGGNPRLAMADAVRNCNQLNVILTDHSGGRKQCIAVVPQYESYHVQKWMRVTEKTKKGDDVSKLPLKLVSRGQLETGRDAFKPPKLEATRQHWEMLQVFLKNVDAVLDDLKPLLEKVARDKKTVVVMVCNFGQSELLMNFVCSATSRNMDISNVIVFTTDTETKELAEGLGLAAYYDHRNFANIPEGAARRYGDPKFVAMMMAKVLCVLYVSWSGYDMLFQDVDIVWYKDPLEYFKNAEDYDIFFQDDGGHSLRYAPYSANSGFYFVRHNDRTRHFLTALLMAGGDMVISTKSHQQALIALLQEHVSLHGLKAKVLSRDMEEFPGGYQYNQKTGKYMRAFYEGKLHPYIFHMSWTLNKDNKLLYFRQMGEWFVKDECIAKKREEIAPPAADEGAAAATTDLKPLCCSTEALVSCHYRDKPSKIPCKDSPPIDKGRPSFW